MTDSLYNFPNATTPSPAAFARATITPQTAPFNTDWHQFVGTDIVAALTGTATSITAVVQRSSVAPTQVATALQPAGPLISPADNVGFSGNLSAGIAPNIYTESGVGWWRISVTAISGGNCYASLSGLGVSSAST